MTFEGYGNSMVASMVRLMLQQKIIEEMNERYFNPLASPTPDQ